MKSRINILIGILALLAFGSHGAFGDNKELKRILKTSKLQSSSAKRMAWTNADTNYAKLFSKNGRNTGLLLDWVGTPAGDFYAYSPVLKYKHDLIQLRREFHVRSSFRKLQLIILVPAPDRVSSVKFGLMKEFAQYTPPALKFKESEKIKIRDTDAELYYQTNGRCSLLLRLEGEVYVRVEGDYADRGDLVKLATLLNFERVSEKLKL